MVKRLNGGFCALKILRRCTPQNDNALFCSVILSEAKNLFVLVSRFIIVALLRMTMSVSRETIT